MPEISIFRVKLIKIRRDFAKNSFKKCLETLEK